MFPISCKVTNIQVQLKQTHEAFIAQSKKEISTNLKSSYPCPNCPFLGIASINGPRFSFLNFILANSINHDMSASPHSICIPVSLQSGQFVAAFS